MSSRLAIPRSAARICLRAKNFVRDWVNYDCPTLYRYTTNQKNVIINGFGITLPVFSNVLVDTYDCKFQLDDTLTEKEINALLKHLNPKGAVAEHLNFAKKDKRDGAGCALEAS